MATDSPTLPPLTEHSLQKYVKELLWRYDHAVSIVVGLDPTNIGRPETPQEVEEMIEDATTLDNWKRLYADGKSAMALYEQAKSEGTLGPDPSINAQNGKLKWLPSAAGGAKATWYLWRRIEPTIFAAFAQSRGFELSPLIAALLPNHTAKTHRISQAPSPIVPLSGRGATPKLAWRFTGKTPLWRKWQHIPSVQVWQACALSLNIDPDSMTADRYGWTAGAGSGPFFESESFPSEQDKEEFQIRVEVLAANLGPPHFSPGTLSLESRAKNGVRLSEFAAWASSVVNWANLPPDLVSIAKQEQARREAEEKARMEEVERAQKEKEQRIRSEDEKLNQAIDQRSNARKDTETVAGKGINMPPSDKPWLVPDPNDPPVEQPWYTPARYFARLLVKEDATLLKKRRLLANKVVDHLSAVGFFKRGGRKKFDGGTVLKSLSNVILG